MTQAKNLERLGVSNSIARKDPLEGNGEVDSYGRRVATWGDFASRFWEEHPEWELEQVYEFLGLSNKPYDPVPQEDVMGNFLPDYDQRTVQNPNPFILAELEYQETKRFQKSMAPNFEAEKERLCSLVDDLAAGFQENDEREANMAAVEQELAILRDKYKEQDMGLFSKYPGSYDAVAHLPESHPEKQRYREALDAYSQAFIESKDAENDVLQAEKKLQSAKDFGVAVSLSELARDMFTTDLEQGTGWDMRVTWDKALQRLVDSVSYESDISPHSKVGNIFVTLNDIDKLKEFILDSNYELRKYGEDCWKVIEPITVVPRLEDHSLVTGTEAK